MFLNQRVHFSNKLNNLIIFFRDEYQGLITYYVPRENLTWSKMFGLMETAKNKFNIEDYSISQTSLEQVFLGFAKDQKDEEIIRHHSRSCNNKLFCICV